MTELIEIINRNKKLLYTLFFSSHSIPDIFWTRILFQTKKENVEGEEEEEEESSSESSEDSDDEVDEEGSNEDETALDLNVCPKGCDNDIYDKVIISVFAMHVCVKVWKREGSLIQPGHYSLEKF